MESGKEKFTIEKARKIDMVEYLLSINHRPVKIDGNNHWYLSPLRDENSASFKVNSRINAWYDHGLGKGGNVIDFGILYFKCSVSQFLSTLNGTVSFQPQPKNDLKKIVADEPKINIDKVSQLSSPALLSYLRERRIDLRLAVQFCEQVNFSLNNKKYYGIGFKNNSNGWEIRNSFFKTSSSPKDYTLIKNGSDRITVFEGFMDYLTFLNIVENGREKTDYLILNSLSFFERAKVELENYQTKNLYLDRDREGIKVTRIALETDKNFTDKSSLYDGYKDLNEWYVKKQYPDQKLKKSPKLRLRP